MDAAAMTPFGEALLAYADGDKTAELIIRRDDGKEVPLPVDVFFREPAAFSLIEVDAVNLCVGRVLDIGAGRGLHSRALADRGFDVTPIDIRPQAVEVMTRRGVVNARCADVFTFGGATFETLMLMLMGHGIGIVQTIAGLDDFLTGARLLTGADGRILLDSLDVTKTDDPSDLAYHEKNRAEGRYIGEIRMQSEFRGTAGSNSDGYRSTPVP